MGVALGAGAVALILVVFFAPDVAEFFQPAIRVVALMDDANALQDNAEVWIAGQPVGAVKSIEFRGMRSDSSERVAVTMRIPRKYGSLLRRDSEARITSQRLIGRRVLDIQPGSPASPQLRDMDSLRVRPVGTLEGLLDKAEALNEGFDSLFDEMRATRLPAIERMAALDELEDHFQTSVSGMRDLFNALERSPMQTLASPEWHRTLANLSSHGQELNTQLQAAAQRARAAHHDARPSLQRLASRADTIAGVLADLKARTAATGGGLLIRAQRDSAITRALHEARLQLDSLMAETKRNPLRFWF